MLDVNFGFLWTAVNLLVLYLFMKKFLFGRVGEIMERRSKAIEDDIAAAKEQLKEAAADRQRIFEELGRTFEECTTLVDNACHQAEHKSEEIVTAATREAERKLQEARELAERERRQAEAELRSEIATLAVRAAGAVLRENLDNDKNRALAEQFLREQDGGAA